MIMDMGGHVAGSLWILRQVLGVVWEVMPLHPNISWKCNRSCKSIKDDTRRGSGGGSAAVNLLIPEAKCPKLNMSSDSFSVTAPGLGLVAQTDCSARRILCYDSVIVIY